MPIAPMHAEPSAPSAMVSQQLAGHQVDVLEESAEWRRIRGEDDYEGWVHAGFLSRAPDGLARQSRNFPRVSLGCVTETASGDRRALPLRALLAPEETLKSGEAVEINRLASRFPPDRGAIVETAQRYFFGTSYLWGGITPWGADCSGLAQSVFALHDVRLPRDAWQQAQTGGDAGLDIASLAPADLLFFSDREDRRVTHVGISLGGSRMAHSALGRGGFAIERLDDRSDAYVSRLVERFVSARTVL
jgi:cell wall-associated NlpC family hydrolase